jgi:hypothetical protein
MSNDCKYYYGRAEREIEMARRAAHPAAFRVHYDLADRYLVLAVSPITAIGEAHVQRR